MGWWGRWKGGCNLLKKVAVVVVGSVALRCLLLYCGHRN